jgi:hypothetical protein
MNSKQDERDEMFEIFERFLGKMDETMNDLTNKGLTHYSNNETDEQKK